jgi:hypothetical protein
MPILSLSHPKCEPPAATVCKNLIVSLINDLFDPQFRIFYHYNTKQTSNFTAGKFHMSANLTFFILKAKKEAKNNHSI